MLLGTCVTNHNGDIGYTVSTPFQDKDSAGCLVKVIWVDPLLRAAGKEEMYPETLLITDERQLTSTPIKNNIQNWAPCIRLPKLEYC